MARMNKSKPHYRLDFIAENTFNRVWSVRMTRARAFWALAGAVAAVAALIFVILAYTPLRGLLPGSLRGDLRAQYLEASLRLDSLENVTRTNQNYLQNIVAILKDEHPDQAAPVASEAVRQLSDSLLRASEAEREFVRRYQTRERFNLSVLGPITAEGMTFVAPASPALNKEASPSGRGMILTPVGTAPFSAVYRGSVIVCSPTPDGGNNIIIQHPNGFISSYTGIEDVFVGKGSEVAAGQRIGHSSSPVLFELWLNGTALDPADYVF